MSLERRTIVDQIELTGDGKVQIRLGLLLIEDGAERERQWHRTTLVEHGDFDVQLNAIAEHLAQMSKPMINAAGIAKIRKVVEALDWQPMQVRVAVAHNSRNALASTFQPDIAAAGALAAQGKRKR
jgi:hypothetical protein